VLLPVKIIISDITIISDISNGFLTSNNYIHDIRN